ncbi:MAG: exo-beta-N-acetylmuramidase NamZ domain-containing protein, partial [Crocinitomicaceae bacterium]
MTSCGNYELKNKTLIGEVQRERDTIQKQEIKETAKPNVKPIQLGIERFSMYLDSLSGKRIAIVANQTSVVKKSHLVDTLFAMKMQVVKVFSPEHGFRGDADAGER